MLLLIGGCGWAEAAEEEEAAAAAGGGGGAAAAAEAVVLACRQHEGLFSHGFFPCSRCIPFGDATAAIASALVKPSP